MRTTQMPDTRSVVKALYIYTFATLVEWPQDKRTGDFIIGVYGISGWDVYDELSSKYSEKHIGSQKIVVQNYRKSSDIGRCHILYVAPEKSSELSDLSKRLKPKNTLLVAEKPGALSRGASVNFIVVGNQQKYEINKKNAKNHNLVIADKLSNLAANVIE